MIPITHPAQSLREYTSLRDDGWRLWVRTGLWDESWLPLLRHELEVLAGAGRRSRHASSRVLELPAGGGAHKAYLKRYAPHDVVTGVKDLFRGSKPRQALRASVALAAAGIGVAPVVAAGERRRARVFQGGMLLTLEVPGSTLARWLSRARCNVDADTVRRMATALGVSAARFHETGFIHGDMVATNVLVPDSPGGEIVFIDHDRTRHLPRLVRDHYARRNLVQLHRLLPDFASRTDRARFFHAYADYRGWSRERRRAFLKALAVQANARGYPL